MTKENKPTNPETGLNDSIADRDIWDTLLASEASEAAMDDMVAQAQKDEQNGNLEPM